MGTMKVTKMKKNLFYRALGVVGAVFVPAAAIAAFTTPNVFVESTTLSSADMNENFEEIRLELEALQGRLDAQESGPDLYTEYTSLDNNWTAFDAGRAPQSRLDSDGMVHLQGMIKGGTDGEVFTLADGHGASTSRHFVVTMEDSSTAHIFVGSSVAIDSMTGNASVEGGFVSLDGIVFSTR